MRTPDTRYTQARPHVCTHALGTVRCPGPPPHTRSGLHFPAPAQEGSPSRAVCFQVIPPSSGVTCTQAQFTYYPAPPLGQGEGGLESKEDNPW